MDSPTLETELALRAQGHRFVAGLDEAGRGAWAGPVVAAAVMLPLDRRDLDRALAGVRDSKQLSPPARNALLDIICHLALGVGVGVSAPVVVDRDGVLPATRRAMRQAIARLSPQPGFLIVDHLRLPTVPLPQIAFPRADAQSFSVAAASIVAKVTRDRLMGLLDQRYPGYGFARHKGYGTALHRAALADLGPTPIHRMSFAPLSNIFVK
ncbi:MAG: ribonuclease HII [Anaerolineales bacterium]|nr:MAG: ribonuclease HII [Anaerolineales bacterium]